MSCVARWLWRRSERIVPCQVPVLLVAMTVLMLWTGTIPAEIASPARAAEAASEAAKDGEQAGSATQQRPTDRPAAIRALAARLEIGEGNAVADIGAGKGGDTWVFAEIVGPSGVVYSEEITENQIKSLRAEAEKRKLTQVRPVLGRDDSPALPPASVDLAYMRLVYHHFSKPREMLREILRALKPGGYFVVVDRLPGTLRDWVPREQRTSKHFWLAETTVVREAREEGFRFVACADELCESKDNPFVLIFQRPENQLEPGRDPDPFLPLAVSDVTAMLLPPGKHLQRPVIVALGQARELIPPILDRSSGAGLEIVLEEWATQKGERPPLPTGVSLPSVLTDLGDPHLGSEPIDAVFFLDTYHLLFHSKTLLTKLYERLTPDGCVYVLDRAAKEPLPRRDASHRRQIDPVTVKQELTAAGFVLQSEGQGPTADRFLLVFGKTKPHAAQSSATSLPGIDCPLRRAGIDPAKLKPFEEVEKYIDFKEGDLPEGPPESIKVPKAETLRLCQQAGFQLQADHAALLPYQQFLVFQPVFD